MSSYEDTLHDSDSSGPLRPELTAADNVKRLRIQQQQGEKYRRVAANSEQRQARVSEQMERRLAQIQIKATKREEHNWRLEEKKDPARPRRGKSGAQGDAQGPNEAGQGSKASTKLPKSSEEAGVEWERNSLLKKLGQVHQDLKSIKQSISNLAKGFEPFRRSPVTVFLLGLVSIFQDSRDTFTRKLERLLRRLLDQDIIDMNLVLFFDTLDEFNGHMDVISRFLKDVIKDSPKSLTRAKFCFSSRPWAELAVHFSESDGVFLWVKLALSILRGTVTSNPDGVTLQALEKRLFELPDDLFRFYELIIERISKANCRRTFAVIELVVRHNDEYGPITAMQIRDAEPLEIAGRDVEYLDVLDLDDRKLRRVVDDKVKGLIRAPWDVDRPKKSHPLQAQNPESETPAESC
ncbi:hypothetical protein B0T25DRAFT_566142 [Lasiosphaeria hispida]|uniref:Uncharacterized protein n=1 Tax=Lasiosphaeria hispida TaxID=260671 RepID=A0AAJ0HKZ6_9PEZI|nr:hypothetical protein B0T25DRAFT_566142 [Lasiosphaeria hispida]